MMSIYPQMTIPLLETTELSPECGGDMATSEGETLVASCSRKFNDNDSESEIDDMELEEDAIQRDRNYPNIFMRTILTFFLIIQKLLETLMAVFLYPVGKNL